MTEVLQNALGRHSIDESVHQSADRETSGIQDRQVLNEVSQDSILRTVNISFNAQMRLQAYQEQKVNTPPSAIGNESLSRRPQQASNSQVSERISYSSESGFSQKISHMLTEVESNIVQSSEPGYRYLVNMLNNYGATLEDPQQLQAVMRKEEFFLSRRKAFMGSEEFQSYSQVLSQFSNIIGRQEYA